MKLAVPPGSFHTVSSPVTQGRYAQVLNIHQVTPRVTITSKSLLPNFLLKCFPMLSMSILNSPGVSTQQAQETITRQQNSLEKITRGIFCWKNSGPKQQKLLPRALLWPPQSRYSTLSPQSCSQPQGYDLSMKCSRPRSIGGHYLITLINELLYISSHRELCSGHHRVDIHLFQQI